MKESKSMETIKIILIVIGAIVSIAAVLAVAYSIFKKYFEVKFECDGDCDACDCDCEDCFPEVDVDDAEPVCCCGDEEAPAADAE